MILNLSLKKDSGVLFFCRVSSCRPRNDDNYQVFFQALPNINIGIRVYTIFAPIAGTLYF